MIKFNLIVSLLILPIMATDIAAQARFTPKELPYAYDALAPQVSEETLRFHHDKHYVGYVNKLNELILDTPYAQQPLEDIVVSADGAIFNNAAQMWNHEFFFDQLSPDSEARPTGALLKAIDADFGSFEQFKAQMEKAAVGLFGSGWAWLAEDKSGKLAIVTEQNAGNPMCHGMKPLMCFDVWEHAYYIDYRNRRPDFLAAFWELIDWQKVADRCIPKRYKCTACDYVYDPAKGDPETGIEPGTPFEEIPDDWTCPICGLYKTDFEAVEE